MSDITVNSTGQIAHFLLLDSAGAGLTGVAYNASNLDIKYVIGTGTPTTFTLSATNWHELGNGVYAVDCPDAVYTTIDNIVTWTGSIDTGTVLGVQQRVVSGKVDLVDAPNATAVTAIAAAVWAVATSGLTGVGTIGKLVTDTLTNLASMIEDSTGWRFTSKALEQGPSGSSGGSATLITVAQAVINTTTISPSMQTEWKSPKTLAIAFTSDVDISGYADEDWRYVVEDNQTDRNELMVIEPAAISYVANVSDNTKGTFSISVTASDTAFAPGNYIYSLRRVVATDNEPTLLTKTHTHIYSPIKGA